MTKNRDIADVLDQATTFVVSETVGNSTVNVFANSTTIKLANSTSNTMLTVPSAADWAGNKYLHANGSWATVAGLTLPNIVDMVSPDAAPNTSNQLTLDVANGANLFFYRTMANNETLLNPVNMPVGTTASLRVVPTSTSYPTVLARTAGTDAANATSRTLTLPSGVTVGELLLVIVSLDGTNTGITINTTLSGNNWTELVDREHSATVTGLAYWKEAEGGNVLSLNTALEMCSWASFRVGNWSETPSPIIATSANNSATNADPPLVTPAGGSFGYLWIAAACMDAQVVALIAPSTFTNLQTNTAVSANGASISTAEFTSTAASMNPGTFTSATEQYVSMTIAIGHNGAYRLTYDTAYVNATPIPDKLLKEFTLQIQHIESGRYTVTKNWEAP